MITLNIAIFHILFELYRAIHCSIHILHTSANSYRLSLQYLAGSRYEKRSSLFNIDIQKLKSVWISRLACFCNSQKILPGQCEMRCSMPNNNHTFYINCTAIKINNGGIVLADS